MPSTPNRGYTYPTDTDPATVPADMAIPLTQIDADVQTLTDEKASVMDVAAQIAAVETPPAGDIPIFKTLAEAEAWETANPGRTALTIEPQTPDVTPPTPGSLSVTPIDVSALLVASGATDDRGVTGYAFRVDNGAWTDWQSEPEYTMPGLAPATQYVFQHRVKDKAENTALGEPVTATTTAMSPRTPAEVGSLWEHWDASEPDTLAVLGGSVSAWTGTTANARTLSQATSAQQPVTVTMDGKTAVQFDKAASKYMRFLDSAATMDVEVGYTLCWVGRFDAALDTVGHGVAWFSSGARMVNRTGGSLAGTIGSALIPGLIGPASERPAPGEVVFAALVVKASGPSFAYVSGASGDPVSGGTQATTGSAFDIGRSDSAGYGSTTVGEVWAHDRPLTTSELDALHLHAQLKWGAK